MIRVKIRVMIIKDESDRSAFECARMGLGRGSLEGDKLTHLMHQKKKKKNCCFV